MSPLHRRRTAESIVFALLLSSSLLSAARAEEPGFKPIFNGKDLTGWRLGGDRAGRQDGLRRRPVRGQGRRPRHHRLEGHAPQDGRDRHGGVLRRRLHPPPGIPRLPGCEQRPPPAGQGLRPPAPDPRLPAGRPIQGAPGLQGRRLERDRGGRHRHQGPLHLQRRAARGRARHPRPAGRSPCNPRPTWSSTGTSGSRGRIEAWRSSATSPTRPRARRVRCSTSMRRPGRRTCRWSSGSTAAAGRRATSRSVQVKPRAFTDKGFVFVSTNYRLLPHVEMGTIVRDIAGSIRWVHDHIAEHGGDPRPSPRHGPFRRRSSPRWSASTIDT